MADVPTLEAVRVSLQLEVPITEFGTSLQVGLKNVAVTPVCEKLTVPLIASLLGAVEGCSVTVTVQMDGWLTTTGLAHTNVVDVARRDTVMLADAVVELPL